VSGQRQDVSGQHQTHLGWAAGQSKEKKEKEKQTVKCLTSFFFPSFFFHMIPGRMPSVSFSFSPRCLPVANNIMGKNAKLLLFS
jgi:hypothetical protein